MFKTTGWFVVSKKSPGHRYLNDSIKASFYKNKPRVGYGEIAFKVTLAVPPEMFEEHAIEVLLEVKPEDMTLVSAPELDIDNTPEPPKEDVEQQG